MTDNHFEEIERYLNGRMDAVERSAFEARLAEDAALTEALQQHRTANDAIRAYRDEQLRKALRSRSSRILHPRRRTLQLAAAAAAVLLLVLAVRFTIQYFGRADGAPPPGPVATLEEVVSAVPPPAVPGNLSGQKADSIRQKWNDILQDFSAGKYDEARRQLSSMIRDSTFREYYGSRARLYLGYCHYLDGETARAEEQLQAIPTTTSLWREAQFYRALNDIKAGQQSQALERLRQIADDPQNKMQETARQLIPLLEDKI